MLNRAAASIRSGRVYPLGIPIQAAGVPLFDYRGRPMRLTLQDNTDEGMYQAAGLPSRNQSPCRRQGVRVPHHPCQQEHNRCSG